MRSTRCRRIHDQAGSGSQIALESPQEKEVGCWPAGPFRDWVAVARYQGRSSDREMQAVAGIPVAVGRLVAREAGLVNAIA